MLTFSSRQPLLSPRTRRLVGLCLLLVAWLQMLAPVLSHRLQALAADPLGHAIICAQAAGDPAADGQTQAPARPVCAHEHCCLGTTPPVPPLAPETASSLRWLLVSWPIPPPAAMPPMARVQSQPRAPPHA